MQADSVEVVALPVAVRNVSSRDLAPAAPDDSLARLRAIDDSAASLETRFRDLRAAITSQVAAIDTIDRRSRAYATRYDAIVRQTRDAEEVRAKRDSLRAGAERLRARLGQRAGTVADAPTTIDPRGDGGDESAMQRHRIRGGSVTLSLAPGAWWIGVARAGSEPVRYDSLTVRTGATDTLDLRGDSSRPRPDGR